MSGKPREPSTKPIAPPPIPPRSWGRPEGALWRRILASFPEGHFRDSDSADLAAYVRAWIEGDDLEAVIAQEGRVLTDAKTGRRYANPACVLRDRAWSRLRDAGTKLRLHLSSRMRSEDANTATKNPASGNRRPWDYEDDVPTKPRRNGKTIDVAKRYGLS